MSGNASPIMMGGVTIDSEHAGRLADFYAKLFGWEKFYKSEEFAAIRSPDKSQTIGFQTVDDYSPPVWPWETGKQAQMMHLDVTAEDVRAGIAHALECGAVIAPKQYDDGVAKVMLDPAGHPFCVCPKRQQP
jgi:predicted enzyme related to lactoylglutathione lyase